VWGIKQDSETCEILGYKVYQEDDNTNCFNILHSCGLYIYKLVTSLARTHNKLHYAGFITVITAHLMEILLYLAISEPSLNMKPKDTTSL
jgi:hypothetical protein